MSRRALSCFVLKCLLVINKCNLWPNIAGLTQHAIAWVMQYHSHLPNANLSGTSFSRVLAMWCGAKPWMMQEATWEDSLWYACGPFMPLVLWGPLVCYILAEACACTSWCDLKMNLRNRTCKLCLQANYFGCNGAVPRKGAGQANDHLWTPNSSYDCEPIGQGDAFTAEV